MPDITEKVTKYIADNVLLGRGLGMDAACRGHTSYPEGFYANKTNTAACPRKEWERHGVAWSGVQNGKRLVIVEMDKPVDPEKQGPEREYLCDSISLAILAAGEEPHDAYRKSEVKIDVQTGNVLKCPEAEGLKKEDGWKACIDFMAAKLVE